MPTFSVFPLPDIDPNNPPLWYILHWLILQWSRYEQQVGALNEATTSAYDTQHAAWEAERARREREGIKHDIAFTASLPSIGPFESLTWQGFLSYLAAQQRRELGESEG